MNVQTDNDGGIFVSSCYVQGEYQIVFEGGRFIYRESTSCSIMRKKTIETPEKFCEILNKLVAKNKK